MDLNSWANKFAKKIQEKTQPKDDSVGAVGKASLDDWASKFTKKIQEKEQPTTYAMGAVAKAPSMARTSASSDAVAKLKFPAAFLNAQSVKRALPAREPHELMLGMTMDDFAQGVISQIDSENPQSNQVRAAKAKTQLMEATHCQARLLASGGPQDQVDFMSLRIMQLESEIEALKEAIERESASDVNAMQQQQMAMMQQFMQQMQETMKQTPQQRQMQQATPPMHNARAAQPNAGSSASAASSAHPGQGDAVFDAVFEAQQAQYMRQLEFMNQMKTTDAPSTLIGLPTGKIYECRFAHDFRPIEYCKNFFTPQGCKRAAMCTYAHCFEELHPNMQEMEKDGTEELDADEASKSVPDMKMKRKKELCNKFKRDGECLLGKHCPFAHGEHEIGTVELCVMEQVKIKICPHWKENKCYYGKRCTNAHGEAEIGTKKPTFRPDTASTKKRKPGQSIEEWRMSLFNPKFLAAQGLMNKAA